MNYKWFVECDANTNKQIAQDFAQEEAERLHPKMACADKERRDLWEVPYRYIRNKLVVNMTECKFVFKVFRSRGSGRPEVAPRWLYNKKATRPDKKPPKFRKDKRQLLLPVPEHLQDPSSSPFK